MLEKKQNLYYNHTTLYINHKMTSISLYENVDYPYIIANVKKLYVKKIYEIDTSHL